MADRESPTERLAELAGQAGLRCIHVLAWRDLADAEAGGSEIHADEVARRWAAAGIDVVLRSSAAPGLPARETRHGYRVVRRGGRHRVFLDAPVQEVLGRDGRADGIVEVWNGVPFLTPLWARVPRLAFIHHVHEDMWDQSVSPWLATVGRNLEVRIAPRFYRATTILTPSESSRQDIVRRLGLSPARIHAVPNGVDDRFSPGGARAARPTVLTVGRLVPHKRVDRVIDAVAALRGRLPSVRLVVVGDGYVRDELEARARSHDGGSWVRFAGHVDPDDLVDLYRQAWVVTSGSSAEGWGLTLSEAAATGTAAVATDIPGHRDVLVHDETGLLTDPDHLADTLGRVLLDDALRTRFEAAARARADHFSWDVTAHGILAALAAEARPDHRP